jgi:hypothetical protein
LSWCSISMSLCDTCAYVCYLCVFLTMTNVTDQNQTIQSFKSISYKKNTRTKTKKKRKITGKNYLLKPKIVDKFYVILKWYYLFLIDQFILRKIVGNGCGYEYSDTSKVPVQVRVQILLSTQVWVIIQTYLKLKGVLITHACDHCIFQIMAIHWYWQMLKKTMRHLSITI